MARRRPNAKTQGATRVVMLACGAVMLLIGGTGRGAFFLTGAGLGMIGWAIWGSPWQWRREQRKRDEGDDD